MKVVRVHGYKTELDLNDEQRTGCMKHAGASRFAYNWGLARSKEAYHATGKRPTLLICVTSSPRLKPGAASHR
jgi:putative transposase